MRLAWATEDGRLADVRVDVEDVAWALQALLTPLLEAEAERFEARPW